MQMVMDDIKFILNELHKLTNKKVYIPVRSLLIIIESYNSNIYSKRYYCIKLGSFIRYVNY